MNWLVYHVVSGQAFFTGVVLLIGAAFASTCATPVFRRLTALSFLTGIIAVVVSSTAIPYWYYAVTGVITVVWMISKWRTQWRQWTPYAVIGVWLVAGLIELPYHVTHSLLRVSERKITVIGETAASALKRTKSQPIISPVVVVEIGGNDSTLDSIHLSQSGHQTMADTVWRSVGSAFDGTK